MVSRKSPCNTAWNVACAFLNSINSNLSEYSPATLVAGTAAGTAAITIGGVTAITVAATFATTHFVRKIIRNANKDNAVKIFASIPFNVRIPGVGPVGPQLKAKMEKEEKDTIASLQKDVDRAYAQWEYSGELSKKGWSKKKILERFEKVGTHTHPAKNSGATYAEYSEEEIKMLAEVWSKTALTNPMHSSQNPEINLSEAEIISALQKLLKGDLNSHGIMTNGGTFSILHACFAYVQHARANGIITPEIIVPSTAHAAFRKAARYADAKLVIIPVKTATGAADVAAMSNAITSHTCMMVGSAPSFPWGVYDPIAQLAESARSKNIPLHVDACLGGFLNIFSKKAKQDIPCCDFSIKGVTSISIDTHKYGQTPKGTSVLLFGPECPAEFTAQIDTDWEGGMYATPGMAGSRAGSDIAVAWSLLFSRGEERYIEDAKAIFRLKDELVEQLKQIDDIYIPYPTPSSMLAIKAKPLTKESKEEKPVNILVIESKLHEAGWNFNTVQSSDQKSHGLHFCLTSVHANYPGFVKMFIDDLKKAVEYSRAHPDAKPTGLARIYKALSEFVPTPLQHALARGYVGTQYNLSNRKALGAPEPSSAMERVLQAR